LTLFTEKINMLLFFLLSAGCCLQSHTGGDIRVITFGACDWYQVIYQ